MHKRGLASCGVCLSRSWILSKRINISSNFFHHRVAHHSSFFSIQKFMAIFWRGPPNGGVDCRCGRLKSRFSTNIWLCDRNCCTVVSLSHLAAGFFLLTAGRTATRYNQSRSSVAVYSARLKRGLALYTVTVVRESCVLSPWLLAEPWRLRELTQM